MSLRGSAWVVRPPQSAQGWDAASTRAWRPASTSAVGWGSERASVLQRATRSASRRGSASAGGGVATGAAVGVAPGVGFGGGAGVGVGTAVGSGVGGEVGSGVGTGVGLGVGFGVGAGVAVGAGPLMSKASDFTGSVPEPQLVLVAPPGLSAPVTVQELDPEPVGVTVILNTPLSPTGRPIRGLSSAAFLNVTDEAAITFVQPVPEVAPFTETID